MTLPDVPGAKWSLYVSQIFAGGDLYLNYDDGLSYSVRVDDPIEDNIVGAANFLLAQQPLAREKYQRHQDKVHALQETLGIEVT